MIEPMVDHRGTKIEIGQKVVYNLSGEAAMGIVESVKPAGEFHKGSIKIKVMYPLISVGKISDVRHPKNLMVIFEGD